VCHRECNQDGLIFVFTDASHAHNTNALGHLYLVLDLTQIADEGDDSVDQS
jgi:hypothetical protein